MPSRVVEKKNQALKKGELEELNFLKSKSRPLFKRRWIGNLYLKDSKALLEKNVGEKFYNIIIGKIFLKEDTKALTIKEKADKINYIKFKNGCLSKDNIKRVNRQATDVCVCVSILFLSPCDVCVYVYTYMHIYILKRINIQI